MRIRSPFRAFRDVFIRKGFVEAQLIVTRRCNLSCGYCTEFDNVSKPIPLPVVKERIDALHRLGVVQIAMLGGEPLMHDQIAEIVTHANRRAQTSMTTNGFLISKDVIDRLNDANLGHMQVSIDTLRPTKDLYIQKSMKTIHKKLELLRERARFSVHSNIVLCDASVPDFREMVDELRRLQIPVTVNLLHNDKGYVTIGGDDFLELWDYHHDHSKVISHIEYEYGRELLQGKTRDWQCRAGSRHIYVDEFGNAQFCASQRGRLDKPIVDYTRDDMKRYREEPKGCEKGCAVFCVYRASQLDNDPIGVAKAIGKSLRRGTVSIPIWGRNERDRASGPSLSHADSTERA